MSSFVINKLEYVKAAGFMAAIAAETDHPTGEPVLRLWNRRAGRCYTDADFMHDAVRLYSINALAVAEQYGDATVATDNCDYADQFTAAKAKGAQLMRKGYRLECMRERMHLQRAIYSTVNFFDSIRYQIEGDEHTRHALMILNKYYRAFYDILRKLDHIPCEEVSSWGSFDALDEDE